MPEREDEHVLDRIARAFDRALLEGAVRAGTQLPFLGPFVHRYGERQGLLPEPGSLVDILGLIAGNLVPAGLAYRGVSLGARAAQQFFPQLAARLPQLTTPLGRAIARDVAAAPIFEALRWTAGQEPDLAQSLGMFGAAGGGALAAERLFGPRRLPVLGGALAGAVLGAQPFVEPGQRVSQTLTQALPLGVGVGLLSPLGRGQALASPPTPSPRERIQVRTPEPVQTRLPLEDVPRVPPEVLRQEVVPPTVPGPAMLRREIPRPENPVQLDLDFGDAMAANPAAKAADFIAQGGPPGLFRPTFEVVGDKHSLPRNVFFKLPKRLQEQLGEVDESIKQANAHMERLLRQHKVELPGQLPEQARVEYEQAAAQLMSLARSRDELKPAIIGALERRKGLGPAILEAIEAEKAAGLVTTRLPRVTVEPSVAEPPVPIGTPGRTPIRDPRTVEVHQQLAQPRLGEVPITEEMIAEQVDPTHLGLARVPDPQEGRVAAYAWEMNLDEVARDPEFVRVTRTPGVSRLTLSPRQYVEEMRASSPGIQGYYASFSRDLFGGDVYHTLTTEAKKMTIFTRLWSDRLVNILEKHKTTSLQSRERIGRLLDGQDVPGVTQAERSAAADVRRLFYGEGPGQGLHKEFGIPTDMWLRDYLPHVRTMAPEELDRVLANLDPRYQNFFAEFHRYGDMTENYDVLDTGLRYLRAGAKKKFIEPALQQLEPLVDQMHPDRRRLFEGMVNSIFGRPTDQERLINSTLRNNLSPLFRALKLQFPDRPVQELSRFMALATHGGTLAFNINSALKNWTQRFHAAALTSPGDFLWAERARRTDTGKFLLRYNEVAQQRLYLEGMELEQRIVNRVLGNIVEFGMRPFERADIGNVQVSYLAGVRQALRQGKSWAEAIEHGNHIARLTQFEYGLNQPAFLRTPVGRVLGALQSYPLHMARLMYDQLAGDEKWRAGALVVTMAAVKHLYEKLTGLHAPVSVPETLAGHPALPGSSLAPPAQVLADAANWVVRFTQRDPQALEEATASLKKSLATFIPGSVQLRRMQAFIDRAANDWVVADERGRQLYRVSESEAIRGLIGPTVESQERWRIRNDLSLLVQELAEPGSTYNLFHPDSWVRPTPERIRAEAQALLRRAAQHGMDPKQLQESAISRTRSYYYSKFWPAVVEGEYEQARKYADALKRLGVSQENVMQSGERSGMHPALVMQGAVLFGPGIPRLTIPPRPATPQLTVPPRPTL